jgi:hypothetical protein
MGFTACYGESCALIYVDVVHNLTRNAPMSFHGLLLGQLYFVICRCS